MRKRRGGTLIELLVALLLLDLALLSLATVGAVTVKRVGDANRRSRAALAAVNRVESASASSCLLATGGARRLEPGVTEVWATHRSAFSLEIVDSIYIAARQEHLVLRRRIPCV